MKSLYFAYDPIDGVDALEPGSMVITGRGNRYHDAFQRARARGVDVATYWNPYNIPVGTKNPQDLEQWGDTTKVPRWRFNDTGPVRSNWENTELADIRPGSAYRKAFIEISEKMIRKNLWSGFFCDTLGAQPWAAGYEGWPIAEQKLWTECAVDISRELFQLCQRVDPKFLKIDNNVWHLPPAHPAAAIAKTGDQYCHGVCLENPPTAEDANGKDLNQPLLFHVNYASHTFGVPTRRILLLIAPNPVLAVRWAMVPGITHISLIDKGRGQKYAHVTPALDQQIAALGGPSDSGSAARIAELEDALASANAQLAAARQELASRNTDLQSAVARVVQLEKSVDKLTSDLTYTRQVVADNVAKISDARAAWAKITALLS